jgi:uncharacterized protein YbjT (DUF2867 family)
MRILVTGATGTVGAELVMLLSRDNHHVRAVSRKPGLGEPPAGVEAVAADLNDPATSRA